MGITTSASHAKGSICMYNYHLNNIAILFVIICVVATLKILPQGNKRVFEINSLKDPATLNNLYQVVSKAFSALTVLYILSVYLFAAIPSFNRNDSSFNRNERDVRENIIDFSFEAIGLPNWKMDDTAKAELDQEKVKILSDQINEALREKLLICEYPDKSLRFFWYDAAASNQIVGPFGSDYVTFWDKHPLRRIDGKTGVCPKDREKGARLD